MLCLNLNGMNELKHKGANMLSHLIILILGLIIGWNFIPQPAFVKLMVNKVVEKASVWFKGTKG